MYYLRDGRHFSVEKLEDIMVVGHFHYSDGDSLPGALSYDLLERLGKGLLLDPKTLFSEMVDVPWRRDE